MINRLVSFVKANGPAIGVLAALAVAAVAGGLTAVALGTTSQEPTRTVTVNVATGPQGPAGPQGPPGPPGPAQSCPSGFSFGVLVLNAPGGQVSLATCLKDT